MSLVLDVSVVGAWLLPGELAPGVDDILDAVRRDRAMVPSIWGLEVANMLAMSVRRGRLDAAAEQGIVADLLALPVEPEPTDPAHGLTVVLPLARRLGLTAYDAAYLELASRRGLPLASLDRGLRDAARGAGVTLLPASPGPFGHQAP